jgi:hypothetical protein
VQLLTLWALQAKPGYSANCYLVSCAVSVNLVDIPMLVCVITYKCDDHRRNLLPRVELGAGRNLDVHEFDRDQYDQSNTTSMFPLVYLDCCRTCLT